MKVQVDQESIEQLLPTVTSEDANAKSDEQRNPSTAEMKHPLNNNWTLWLFMKDQNRAWEDSQVQVATFGSVEDFWALHNHVENASRLPVGCDYSLFKEGIFPAWEDIRNCDGGRWLIQLDPGERPKIDRYWTEVLMMLIGEAFDTENEYICGCVINIRRKYDKIAVWVSCNPMIAGINIMKIGQTIKDRLRLGPKSLTFETHADVSKKTVAAGRTSFTL